MHTSLDGFIAGPKGELDWINFDDELFDFVGSMTDTADTALYGRKTFEIMQNYWPNAGNQPNPSKHDKEHSTWYNNVSKVVLSKTINENDFENTTVISDQLSENINKIKNQAGKNIIIFGSPTASLSLLNKGLIDEFWLFVNPILLAHGIPMFKALAETTKLQLIEAKTFKCGVIALHYQTKR